MEEVEVVKRGKGRPKGPPKPIKEKSGWGGKRAGSGVGLRPMPHIDAERVRNEKIDIKIVEDTYLLRLYDIALSPLTNRDELIRGARVVRDFSVNRHLDDAVEILVEHFDKSKPKKTNNTTA